MPTYIVKLDVGDPCVGRAYSSEMELNERLKFARTRADLTQQQVADHFRIARVSVTQWEGGTSRPDQAKFTGLAELYGVPLQWLMDGTGEDPSKSRKPAAALAAPKTPKFIRNRAFKFYVKEWREFMGGRIEDAASAAGLPDDEYEAHEVYPINFTLAQIVGLADELGIRGDQFWFPPPKSKPAPSPATPIKKRSRA